MNNKKIKCRIGKEKQKKKIKRKKRIEEKRKKNPLDPLFVEFAGFCSHVVESGLLVCQSWVS